MSEQDADSILLASAKAVAEGEWDHSRHGHILKWHSLSEETRQILITVAHKGICVGMIAGNLPSTTVDGYASH